MTPLILAVAGPIILLIAVGRSFVWWYFGIGRAIRALESIDARLKYLGELEDLQLRKWRAG